MLRVLKPGHALICLSLLLAGCSIERPETAGRVPDWSASPPARASAAVELVPPAPQIAPPPEDTGNAPKRRTATPETWVSLIRWSQDHNYGPVRQLSSSPAPAFALATTNGTFVLHINSRVAAWNGLELHLAFGPQLINGIPFVHSLDLKKNMEPLVHNSAGASIPQRIIVLDPGHGGQDAGTVSILDGSQEKKLTLDWAERLKPLLAAAGWQVLLTRTNDIDLALSNRVAFAEDHKASLFISLHFNSAAPSQEQAGLETYCLTPAGMPSTLTRGYDDDTSLIFANNSFDAENLQYAFRLHRALLRVTGNDRGVRRARFLSVLRGQNRPAVLIEGGFLSNPAEARQISDPAYRQKLAQAIANALAGSPEKFSRSSAEVSATLHPSGSVSPAAN